MGRPGQAMRPMAHEEEEEEEDGEGKPLLSSGRDDPDAGAPPSCRWCVSSLLLLLLLPLALGAGMLAGGARAHGGDARAALARARLLWGTAAAQPPRPLAPPLPRPPRSTLAAPPLALQPAPLPAARADAREAAEPAAGHEWAGGEVGGADQLNRPDRWGPHNVPPANGSLLLLGILSGSRNFAPRDMLRRALWAQAPWRLGAAWRFVVGTRLHFHELVEFQRGRCGDAMKCVRPDQEMRALYRFLRRHPCIGLALDPVRGGRPRAQPVVFVVARTECG